MEDELGNDEWLTQYGNRDYPPDQPFRHRPREGKETRISLVAGRLSVDDVARKVNRHRTEGAMPGDGARYVRVGVLRDAGFLVEASPSRLIPDHVSVGLAGEGDWTEDVSARLDGCFSETMWKEESE